MTVKELIELFDDWNENVKINYVNKDNDWEVLHEGPIHNFMPYCNGLGDREVLAFGHQSYTLTIRIK